MLSRSVCRFSRVATFARPTAVASRQFSNYYPADHDFSGMSLEDIDVNRIDPAALEGVSGAVDFSKAPAALKDAYTAYTGSKTATLTTDGQVLADGPSGQFAVEPMAAASQQTTWYEPYLSTVDMSTPTEEACGQCGNYPN